VLECLLPPTFAPKILHAPSTDEKPSGSDGAGTRKIDRLAGPISYSLGVLGMPGLTAYTGLLNIGSPQAGETVVVAAASGAGEEKCRFVKEELGFDSCLDHRQPELTELVKAGCPDGIDVYFENVGGHVLKAVLPSLNDFARIPVCGQIAHYSVADSVGGPDQLPTLMRAILVKRLTVRGFIVVDYASQFAEFSNDMRTWLSEGRIKYREDVTDGLENAPDELFRLLKGENFGKKIIRVSSDPTLA
jgi:NADPH-dependent curcumin reductase